MIKVQAHRGFMDNYPENTMIAFQKAYETGCFGIEMDIRKTSDGEFVVIHDTTVDRTTNGTGAVSSMTLAQLKALDAGSWFNPIYSTEKIPSLIEVLDEYQGKSITLILQLYVDVSDVPDVIDLITARNMVNQVHIFGSMSLINAAKTYNSNLFTLNDGAPFISTYQTLLDNAVLNGHNAVSINAGNTQTDLETMISNIHNQGKEVHISTVSVAHGYNTQMAKHIALGTDYILGNNPLIMQSYVDMEHKARYVSSDNYIEISGGKLKLNAYVKTSVGFIKTNAYNAI